MNKKKRNTKLVGVKPYHSACNKGAYTEPQSPEVFTNIIAAMVNPLKISTDFILFLFIIIVIS